MGTPWVVSRCPKYAWFDRTPALRIMMFQRIPSVLKEFILRITRPRIQNYSTYSELLHVFRITQRIHFLRGRAERRARNVSHLDRPWGVVSAYHALILVDEGRGGCWLLLLKRPSSLRWYESLGGSPGPSLANGGPRSPPKSPLFITGPVVIFGPHTKNFSMGGHAP